MNKILRKLKTHLKQIHEEKTANTKYVEVVKRAVVNSDEREFMNEDPSV